MGLPKVMVSVMIFTLDEEIHLPSCLESLDWCDDVIVVDSYSTDNTENICKDKGIQFYQHQFEGFGSQRNWALDNIKTKNPWILILDADERVTEDLAAELLQIAHSNPQDVGAYRLRRRFYMWGRWLRYSSLYPTWVVRFIHRERVQYFNRGHAETQEVQGSVLELHHDLIDENLKGMAEWFERQNLYSTRDAEYELLQEEHPFDFRDLFSGDPLRRRALLKGIACRLPGRAPLYFIYSYVFRLGFLDGRDGLVFCLMKSSYQRMVAIKKYDMKRRAKTK